METKMVMIDRDPDQIEPNPCPRFSGIVKGINQFFKDGTSDPQYGLIRLNGDPDREYNGYIEEFWRPQQLLTLSDEEIKEGDLAYSHYLDHAINMVNQNWIEYQTYSTREKGSFKKVIASYPQLESILPIPQDQVKEWIDQYNLLRRSFKFWKTNQIKPKRIDPQLAEHFDQNGTSLGHLNEFENLDLRIEICKQRASGYYLMIPDENGIEQKYSILPDGSMENLPDGFYSQSLKLVLELHRCQGRTI